MNVLQARRKAGSTAPEKRTGNATDALLAPAVGVMLATRRLAWRVSLQNETTRSHACVGP